MEYKYVVINGKENVIAVSDFLHVAYEKALEYYHARGYTKEDLRIDKSPATRTVFVYVIDSPDKYITIEQVPYFNK